MTFYPFTSQSKARQALKLHKKAGVTLIELIVTCALTVIFMSGVATILPSALKLYNQVRGITYAQQVSGVVINRIRGELENSQNGSATILLNGEGKGTAVKLKNSNGNVVTLTLTDAANPNTPQWYVEKYEGYEIKQSGGSGDTVTINPIDWTFDEPTYMGFFVSMLNFSKATDDTYLVTLGLKSDKYGEYQFEEYIKMYNYSVESEVLQKAMDCLADYKRQLSELGGGKTYTDINHLCDDNIPISYRSSDADVIKTVKDHPGKEVHCHMEGNTISVFGYSTGKNYVIWQNGKWGAVKITGRD